MVDVSSGRKVRKQFLPALNGSEKNFFNTTLEDVYRQKYGGRMPLLTENVASTISTGLKAAGVPKHRAEDVGRRITHLAEDWTPFGALPAVEKGGILGTGLGMLAAVPIVGGKFGKVAKTVEEFTSMAKRGLMRQAKSPHADLNAILKKKVPAVDFNIGTGHPLARQYEEGTLTRKLEAAGLHISDDNMGNIVVGQTKEAHDLLKNARTPADYGMAYGYTPEDIAAFYLKRRGGDPALAHPEFVKDFAPHSAVEEILPEPGGLLSVNPEDLLHRPSRMSVLERSNRFASTMPEEETLALEMLNRTNNVNQAIAELRQAGYQDPGMERAAQWLEINRKDFYKPQVIEATTTLPARQSRFAQDFAETEPGGLLAPIRAYHATRGTFDKFGPVPEYRGATYLATTPEAAQKGATGGAQDFYAVGADKTPLRTLEVDLPNEGIQGLHWTPKETEWFNSMPDKIVGDEALNEAFKGQPKSSNIDWSDVYEHKQIGDRLYEYTKKAPKTYSLEEATKTGRDIYGKQLPHYQGRDVESAKRLRGEGMRGFLVHDEGGVSIAHVDPETLKIIPTGEPGGLLAPIRAYHGSPHSFPAEPGAPLGRFRDTAIGTGEGAQAYGRGHYLAESEGVARSYRDALGQVKIDGKPIDEVAASARAVAGMNDFGSYNLHKIKPGSAPDESIIAAYIGDYGDPQKAILQMGEDDHTGAAELARKMKAEGRLKDVGHMYEVNIAADPEHFLDWDKPLAEQHPVVQEQLRGLGTAQKNRPLAETDVGRELYFKQSQGLSNESASERLKQAGIPGIRYLDQGSRGAGYINGLISQYGTREKALEVARQKLADPSQNAFMRDTWQKAVDQLQRKETSNYVVFDPALINIVRKYGLAAAIGAGIVSEEMGRQMQQQGEI